MCTLGSPEALESPGGGGAGPGTGRPQECSPWAPRALLGLGAERPGCRAGGGAAAPPLMGTQAGFQAPPGWRGGVLLGPLGPMYWYDFTGGHLWSLLQLRFPLEMFLVVFLL